MLNQLSSIISKFDLFGHNVNLFVKGKYKLQSVFGGLFSFSVYALALFLLISNIQNRSSNLTTISSAQTITKGQMLAENQSKSFIFDKTNYLVYFSMWVDFPNGTSFDLPQNNPYYNQTYFYNDRWNIQRVLPSKNCLNADKYRFIGMAPGNLTQMSTRSLCLIEPFEMGLFPYPSNTSVDITELSYTVSKCQNSTQSNITCKSEDEINEIGPFVKIQADIPNAMYDFNNEINPRTQSYDETIYKLDTSLFKTYTSSMVPYYIKTDIGLINMDYVLDSIDFNSDTTTSDIFTASNGNLFQYNIQFSYNQQTYYRKNQKIYEIFANLGGFLNLLLLLGHLLCYTFNSLYLTHLIVNYSFNDPKKKADVLDDDKNFKFSLTKYLFPFLYKKTIYYKAISNIIEYMDISNIIRRLQDIDKMKFILFDEEQRRYFEMIPKPAIFREPEPISPETPRLFDLDEIKQSKSMKRQASREKTTKIDETFMTNPVNKRIIELMDPVILSEIQTRLSS